MKTDLNRGTREELHARIAERRERWAERDAARFELGRELAGRAAYTVPDEQGFLVLEPGAIPEAREVAASADKRIEKLGHDVLVRKYNPGGDTMSRGFLRDRALELDSPYMRFALNESVITSVAKYLGMVPILHGFDAWYSPPAPIDAPRNAQQWHIDGGDTRQLKVWVHCADIPPESGPLTVIDATTSEELAEHISYDSAKEYRVPDDRVDAYVAGGAVRRLAGPAGTIDFVDTSRCFHFGSRVSPGAPARRIFFAQYVTPYAFKFEDDYRDEAPLRHLATESSSELERLVLGAA